MEEIRAPLRVIDQLNAAKGVAVSDPTDVEAHFRTALDGRWGDVPLLNAVSHVEEIPAGSLVRFRCMVQNMYNPEWYVGQYMASNTQTGEQIQGTAQYRESLDVPAGFTPDMQAASKSAQSKKSEGGKAKKKKWSKGKQKEKLNAAVFFDKNLYEKLKKEAPSYKLITPSIISERMRCNVTMARRAIKDLEEKGMIKCICKHGAQTLYTRALSGTA